MAGTDSKQSQALDEAPCIILVGPQLGENIGMVARAMLNCGLTDLRLVRPRDGWPSEKAEAASSGALEVVRGARVFDTTEEAVADLQRLYVTTARSRYMIKPVVTPRQASGEMRRLISAGQKVGVVFGPEKAGLNNEDVALGDAILQVPLNPAFSSLNLAQAVLLVGHEWFQAADETAPVTVSFGEAIPAKRETFLGFMDRLNKTLDEVGFFYPEEKKPVMQRNLRNLFQRIQMSEQEVGTLHGIVSALLGAKMPRAGTQRPTSRVFKRQVGEAQVNLGGEADTSPETQDDKAD
ncbi:RNA methyltransferase [Rhodovibrionaceae bacterium A322]